MKFKGIRCQSAKSQNFFFPMFEKLAHTFQSITTEISNFSASFLYNKEFKMNKPGLLKKKLPCLQYVECVNLSCIKLMTKILLSQLIICKPSDFMMNSDTV